MALKRFRLFDWILRFLFWAMLAWCWIGFLHPDPFATTHWRC